MTESRLKTLEKTLATGFQLPVCFEERLHARLSERHADLEARFLQQDSHIARLEMIVERFVQERGGKNASAANSGNQRAIDEGNQEDYAETAFLGNKNCDKWKQLGIPDFEREDAMGGIGKVERYFQLRGVQEQEKMEVVMVAIEINALS